MDDWWDLTFAARKMDGMREEVPDTARLILATYNRAVSKKAITEQIMPTRLIIVEELHKPCHLHTGESLSLVSELKKGTIGENRHGCRGM